MSVALRKHADWMSKNDDRIMEYLADNGPLRPRTLRDGLGDAGRGLDFRVAYLDQRLEILAEAGLLETSGLEYDLADRGRAYLDGDLDVARISRR